MTESEAMEYVEELGRAGITPGLERIRELLRRMGDPQDRLRFVHIAGTNGKGSTLAYVSTVLGCAGYRVGRFLSPTIRTYRERIQVGRQPITKAALCEGLELIQEHIRAMQAEGLGSPSLFEAETALGFWYFLQKGCDIVVLECGMGGEQDATNVVETAVVNVLASITMDHMAFLGDTTAAIAEQKAGIFRRGVPVVTASQLPEVMEVIRRRAEELNAPVHVADAAEAKHVKYGLAKQTFDYKGYKKLEIALAGSYQIDNAVLAVEVIEALREEFKISEQALRKGLRETQWPGRFTVLEKKPVFIADGAHNADAARRLAESLDFYFTNKRILFIMGILKDKEYRKIIEITAPYAAQIFTIRTPGNPRAMDALELAREVREVNPNVTVADSVEEAIELTHLMAAPEDVIVAFGSLSFLGSVLDYFEKKDSGRSKAKRS
ncbi:MAG: bifunctional folylpolyglutamate synthase/dihydrofolate synthase [Lachnospiraceae bacterium]|nr:bifunctional folylpolyglutamate synthase/dihydrofolate synthase [Lachnospiraceae bacterium]